MARLPGRDPYTIRLALAVLVAAVLLLTYGNHLANSPPNESRLMKRYGMVIGLRAEKLEEYRRLHAAVWPSVLQKIKDCNIQNYSIYLRRLDDGRHYLFSYFEYTGNDFATDMAKMAADETTQLWWAINKPCQRQLQDTPADTWWVGMEEVFHCD